MWSHGSLCHFPSKILHLKALYKGEVSSAAVHVLVSSLFQPTRWILSKARDNDFTWLTLKSSIAPICLYCTFHCLLAEMLPKFFPPVRSALVLLPSQQQSSTGRSSRGRLSSVITLEVASASCNTSGDLMLCMQCINHHLYRCSCINAIPVPCTWTKAYFRKIISMGWKKMIFTCLIKLRAKIICHPSSKHLCKCRWLYAA